MTPDMGLGGRERVLVRILIEKATHHMSRPGVWVGKTQSLRQGLGFVTRVYAPPFFVSSQQKFGVTDIEAPSAGHSSWRTDLVTALK